MVLFEQKYNKIQIEKFDADYDFDVMIQTDLPTHKIPAHGFHLQPAASEQWGKDNGNQMGNGGVHQLQKLRF